MKIKNAIKAAFIFSIAMLTVNCETEKLAMDEQAHQTKTILAAKTWFKEYESNGKNFELVQNLQYNWAGASLIKSEDGTPTIVVPIIELKKDEREFWEQKLYIYNTDKDKYSALLFEAYSNQNIKPESQSVDGGDFTGYMTVWDFKKGAVRAAKFVDNLVVEDGVATFSINRNMTGKAPPDAPCNFVDFGDGYCQSGTGDGINNDPFPLRPVIITGPKHDPKTDPSAPVVYTPRPPITGGGTTPGGYTSPGGSGGGGGGTSNPNPTVNPCDKIKELMANPNFIAKLEELLKKTNLKVETGYSQSKNGPFTQLVVGLSTGSTDSMNIPMTPELIGYIHAHLDNYETGETNEEGSPLIRNPIRMFSPADVGVFLKMVKNAHANNTPIDKVYGTMVSSEGSYQLKFTGDVTQINTTFNWENLNTIYKTYFVNRSGNTISGETKEAQFLNFLKEKGYITGIELYKINKDKTTTKKTLDSNKKIVNINC